VNSSAKSYYVRFTGIYAGSNSSIETSGGYNYFIGIIRPNQILTTPLSSVGTVSFIEATSTYSNAVLSSWNAVDAVLSAYNNYFRIK
jgi:hypothetical protein